MRIVGIILLVLLLVPTWSGDERLPLYAGTPTITYARVALDARRPGRVRLGALTFLGGIHLRSADRAFGGYSSIVVRGDRFLLLSDGGLDFGFTMGADLKPSRYRFGSLPAGPANGWRKRDRDSESMVVDPVDGRLWVGFESTNSIWLYSPGFAAAIRARSPAAMADWPEASGPEAMTRLADGRFLVLSENARARGGGKRALLFDRDPTDPAARSVGFRIVPPRGYRPTDAVVLDDGRLLVLTRRFDLFDGFTAKLLLADTRTIRRGATVRASELATFAYPVLHDNFEGLALSSEAGATILWMLSDDNRPTPFQRTLLLKFRLDLPAIRQTPPRP